MGYLYRDRKGKMKSILSYIKVPMILSNDSLP